MATKGIWVNIDIMNDTNLTANEKFLLAEVDQLSSLEDGCYASNNHFAELIGITRANASRTIGNLVKKKYIISSIKMGTRNRERSIKMIKTYYQNDNRVVSKRQESKENKQSNKQIKKQVPTIEEIEAYIKEKELGVSASKFFNYFDAGNWIDSNGKKVKNWKQKLLTWDNHAKPTDAPKKKERIWG